MEESKRPSKANGKPVATTGDAVDETYQQAQEGEGLKNIQKAKNKEVEMDDIALTMSSLKLVPTSIRFGRRGGGYRR